MSNNINTPNTLAVGTPPVEGDHNTVRGMMANLNCWLQRSLDILNLFDSMNKSQTTVTGELQTLGSQETTDIQTMSGMNPPGAGWDGTPNSPLAPGLQYWLTYDTGDSNFSSTTQALQANISNTQLSYNNQTSAVQTKTDILKDATSGIESEDNSLLQSMDSGLISTKQNENSIRIN